MDTMLPKWLENTKEALTSTKQWKQFVAEIHSRVANSLQAQHVKFSELNPQEQLALCEGVHAELQNELHSSVQNFSMSVSSILDTEIATEIRKISVIGKNSGEEAKKGQQSQSSSSQSQPGSPRFMEQAKVAAPSEEMKKEKGQAELIIEVSTNAIISLLEQLPPEHRALTRLMLGQAFPSTFRLRAYRLHLKHVKASIEFETEMTRSRIETISTIDAMIVNESQSFLSKKQEYNYSRRRHAIMGKVLSYYHTRLMKRGKGRSMVLPMRYYWLVSPLVFVYTGGKIEDGELTPAKEAAFFVNFVEGWEGE